jgi:ABC-type nickel/cobalt efflux system permease component RcnA
VGEKAMIDTALKTADVASKQDGYFLFIATLIIGGATFLWILRSVAAYFVKQHERVQADHSQSRDAYHSSLKLIVTDQNTTTQKVVAVLEHNTMALRDCARELQHCRDQRERDMRERETR